MSAERAATLNNMDHITDASNLISSPVKPSKNVAAHDRNEVSRKVLPSRTDIVSVNKFLALLGEKQQTVNEPVVGSPSTSSTASQKDVHHSKGSGKTLLVEDFMVHLNKLSNEVCQQHSVAEERIHFLLSENKPPDEHPTGTKCRPDFVAIKMPPNVDPPSLMKLERDVTYRPPGQSKSDGDFTWSRLETTGEIYSEGLSNEGAIAQGASYTGYLLQARPDLVSVVGIYINPHKSEFLVYFTDAWGVCRTEPMDWDSNDNLLCACIRRLYKPETRSNIKRTDICSLRPTFTISTEKHGNITDCVLLRVGSPFNRRSTILTNTKLVIKSQYLQKGRRFREDTTLERIHKLYEFPGVVRPAPVPVNQGPTTTETESEASSSSNYGSVAKMGDECIDVEMGDNYIDGDAGNLSGAQEKETAPGADVTMSSTASSVGWPDNRRDKETLETLLVLQDKAGPLVDAETPLEALIAFYDLLEVTRFLYKLRKVLHRDISSGNVLLREKNWKSEMQWGDGFPGMCFATHLLGEKGPDSEADRLHTRVLLIDFDLAEDRSIERGNSSTDRSGTPMFMAHLIRNPMVMERGYWVGPMPQLQPGFALERYKSCVGDRLNEFPENKWDSYRIEKDKKIPYSHRLSYDAESILWLLFSWAMQVQPKKGDVKNCIPEDLWVDLTGGEGARDPRTYFFGNLPDEICHPTYQGLYGLLRSLFKQLSGYQEQAAQPPEEQDSNRMKDEYLHEAFQRTILNFIVENTDKSFMGEKISSSRRLKEPGAGGMSQSKKTPKASSAAGTRDHDAMAGKGRETRSSGQAAKTKNRL